MSIESFIISHCNFHYDYYYDYYYDFKLASSSWAFECYLKPQLTSDYQFQEISNLYR